MTASALHPQVQDAVKCRVVDRQEEGNGDSGGSFQNGHAQLMVGLGAGTQAAPARPQQPIRRTSEPSLRLGSRRGETRSPGAWTGSRDEGAGWGQRPPRAHPLAPAVPFVRTPPSGCQAVRTPAPPAALPAVSLCSRIPKGLTPWPSCSAHHPVSGTCTPLPTPVPAFQVPPLPGSLPWAPPSRLFRPW